MLDPHGGRRRPAEPASVRKEIHRPQSLVKTEGGEIRDLSKEAEAEIARFKQYEQSLLEAAGIWFEAYDGNGRLVVWNSAAEDISGYAREEVLGSRRNLDLLYPVPSRRRAIADLIFGKRTGRAPVRFESEIAAKGGETKVFSWYASRLCGDWGQPLGTIVLGLDISERRRAEARAKKTREIVQALFDAMAELIFITDTKGFILASNAVAARRLRAQRLAGRRIFDALPGHPRIGVLQAHFRKALRTGRPVRFEDSYLGLRFETTIYPIRPADRGIEQVAVCAVDVTAEKIAEARLSQQKALLEEKNVALREMIRQVEGEKSRIEERVVKNVHRLLLPLVAKLKAKGSRIDRTYVGLLEKALRELADVRSEILGASDLRLTQKEIEVANMIESGLTSKEIGRLLDISPRTVEIHRGNLRRKLGLSGRRQSLPAALRRLLKSPRAKYV
ncbi:MAG: PAS domain-containing protein [Acidobacteriota bacterium]